MDRACPTRLVTTRVVEDSKFQILDTGVAIASPLFELITTMTRIFCGATCGATFDDCPEGAHDSPIKALA